MKKYVIGKPRKILAIVNMLIWVPFATMLIVFEVQYHTSIVNGIFLGLVILIINIFIASPIIYTMECGGLSMKRYLNIVHLENLQLEVESFLSS
ncbi:MAG: hypothetical protein V8R63_05695 [Thomasclavelia ramosa]